MNIEMMFCSWPAAVASEPAIARLTLGSKH
jgi:hypothetical protein